MGIFSHDEDPSWSDVIYYEEQVKELKSENEKLKALCDTYKTCYQAKHDDIKGKLFTYKQTLQKIKERCESVIDAFYSVYGENVDIENVHSIIRNRILFAKDILNMVKEIGEK